jgi:hypothetical protein
MLQCLDFGNTKILIAQSFSLAMKKILSFEKIVTQGEEIDDLVANTLILMNYLPEEQGRSLMNSVFESCSTSSETEAFFVILETCLDQLLSQDILIVPKDYSLKEKKKACVTVFQVCFRWLIHKAEYFLLSASAKKEQLEAIAQVVPVKADESL